LVHKRLKLEPEFWLSLRKFSNFYRATACHAAHGIARFCQSVCLSVCLSVRPSVKRMDCDKKKDTYAHILTPHKRTFILVYRHEKWLVGTTTCTWNFGTNWPVRAKTPIFNQYTLVYSTSVVTPSEKVQLTLIVSPLRIF